MLILALMSAVAMLLSGPSGAEEYRIDQPSQWQTWTYPAGAIRVDGEEGLVPVWFGRNTDPLQDAMRFQHQTVKSGPVAGGITARSNPAGARLLTDGDESTWWQPSDSDSLDAWWVEVDLGRVVLLDRLRLVFPDTAGARPFEDFSVYVSEGAGLSSSADVFRFTRVATTTEPNRERVFEADLTTLDRGDLATGQNLVTGDTLRFAPVQYVRFIPHKRTAQAALAEISMVALGDNIGLGTIARGGDARAGDKFQGRVGNLFDGSVAEYWNASAAREAESQWQVGGQWFEWDLGASFWLDEIVLYTWDPASLGRSSFLADSGQLGYELSLSDGAPVSVSGGAGDRIRSAYDFDVLSLVDNTLTPRRWLFDHQFGRRKVRYLFYHHEYGTGRYGYNLWEVFLYGGGYPAEVELVSGIIDLTQGKNITALSWDADLPPQTGIRVQTMSGDTLATRVLYYNRAGVLVSKEKWESLKKIYRGPTEELVSEGADWSGWSEPYAVSGQEFRSPTPRRYLRIKVAMWTEDPQVAPALRALSLTLEEPLVRRGVEAEIFPREARAGVWEEFSYRLRPTYTAGDRGFDRVQIAVPSEARDVWVRIGGRETEGMAFDSGTDTLTIALSQPVTRDSVEIGFTTRLLDDPTRFEAFVASSVTPGQRQGVKQASRTALQVFLPEVTASDRLIANLALASATVTPNGDGINDDLEVSFDLLKTDAMPLLSVYDLEGRLMDRASGQAGRAQRITWDAKTSDGGLVAPGVYICRIEVDAGTGTRSIDRLVHVAY
ncbi:hypothetical protein ACFL6X_00250 [Candidatus Latescibacterota bacterium]